MNVVPHWVNTALNGQVKCPNGFSRSRRMAILTWDEHGNFVESNEFTEYVPRHRNKMNNIDGYSHHGSFPSQTRSHWGLASAGNVESDSYKSKLLSFNDKISIGDPMFQRRVPMAASLPSEAQWTKSPMVNRQPNERPPPLPKTQLPPVPYMTDDFDVKLNAPFNSRFSLAQQDIPQLRELRRKSSSSIQSFRSGDRSQFYSGGSKDADIPPPPPLPFGVPIQTNNYQKKAKDSTYATLSSSIQGSLRPNIQRKLHFPSTMTIESDDGNYSQLYAPRFDVMGVKKPDEGTYNKLREIIAKKSAEVNNTSAEDSGNRSSTPRGSRAQGRAKKTSRNGGTMTDVHKELLSRIPRAPAI